MSYSRKKIHLFVCKKNQVDNFSIILLGVQKLLNELLVKCNIIGDPCGQAD